MYASDRDHVRERLSGRIVASRTRSTVDQSQSGSTWNFDWLFKAQQYGRCESARSSTRPPCAEASHMCDGFYGSEIDVNGDGDKKKSRTKTDCANIREREGRRQWPRGILVELFSPLVSTFREASAFNAYPGSHRIRMFLALSVKRSFLHYKI